MVLVVLFATQIKAQDITVTGTVTDNFGPVIGVNVQVEGTTLGGITDIEGNYTLNNVPKNATLVFSYIGYQTQKIAVNGRSQINVKLAEDSEMLNEVVVVGYGVQRKSDLTGSVASVKTSDALKSVPTGNVSDALQGRMAGVSVLSGSGDPSEDNTIRVRGINSITAETGPLIVVDGFIGGSLQNLNPSDIASIEVLKDASATAVYGSRGANGVILVTTKNPGKDKMTVSFNAFANIKTVSKYPNTMSPYEYAILVNEYRNDVGLSDYYSSSDLADLEAGRTGFNYAREIFRTAVTQNYDLSVSGGNESTTFLASFRYSNDQGILKASSSELYNWRLKVDTKIKKWLDGGLNFYGSYRKSSTPRVNAYRGVFQSAMYMDNTISPKDEDGNYNNTNWNGDTMYNPMGHIWELDSSTQTINNRLQGYVQFNIIDGLTFRSQLGVLFDNRLNTTLENEDSYQAWANGGDQSRAYARSYFNMSMLNTNTLNYVKEFNENHRINATAVFEQSYENDYNHVGRAYYPDYVNITHGYNNLAMSQNSNLNEVESERTITTLMSAMFRMNYVFKNRYMVTASIRADGSSRLAEKWAYFPSAALAWDIKQESFLQDNSFIDQLKLRVGYGSVGNQSVEAYRIYSMMSPTTNTDGSTSYAVDRPSATYLKWERNDQFNVGIDFGILNGRLRLTADWYNKLSKDILLEVAQPTHMGYSSLLRNAGEIKNTGIEFTISADPFVSNDPKGFSWHTDLTLTHNKGIYNKIPTYNHRQQQAGNYQNTLFQMVEGEKLGSFWGYVFEGLWQQSEVDALWVDADGKTDGRTNGEVYGVVAGNSKYTDVNKDGVINEEDQGIIGCGQPTFNWGWNNTFTYKNFDLSFFFVGYHGFDIYNATRQIGLNGITSQQVAPITPLNDWKNHWTTENTNTDIPRWDGQGTENKNMYSTHFVENGSFIKMKSITLGYTLPDQICKNININNLRVYLSIQNPFHITGYSGLDPESTLGDPLIQGVDWGNYPNSRNYLIGLNFSF